MMVSGILIDVIDMNLAIRNPTIHGYLRGMTLGSGSGMNHILDEFYAISKLVDHKPIDAKAIVAFSNGCPAGWGLYSREVTSNTLISYSPDMGVHFQIYVIPRHRRKGIGSAILDKAREMALTQKLCVCYWDDCSTSFFDKNKNKDVINVQI